MSDTKEIGKRVWSLRKEVMHMTQEEFAELIDTTPETVSNIERCVVVPSLITIIKIAECCKVSADYLLDIKFDNAST